MMNPEYVTFDEWINVLSIQYPTANIPKYDGKNWKEYARLIVADPYFAKSAPPLPDVYAEPLQWVKAFSAIY